MDPDIIMLQEVIFRSDKYLLEKKLAKLGWNFYSRQNGLMEAGGLVIITKNIAIQNLIFHKFSHQAPNNIISIPDKVLGKGFLSSEILLNNIKFLLVNTHLLFTYGKKRHDLKCQAKQFSELQKFINNERNQNVILAGDFNANPDSTEILQFSKELGLTESLQPDVFTIDPENILRSKLWNIFGNGRPYRTDYIFTTKKERIISAKIVFSKPLLVKGKKIQLSDHFGVLTLLEI
jgi:endonuclease/exonuclease/phosphatase family metal-dependent hydrolase